MCPTPTTAVWPALKCLQALVCQDEGRVFPLCGRVSLGYQEEHRLLFYTLGVLGNGWNGFFLCLLRPPSGQVLGFPWSCCHLESNCSHPGRLPATLSCCKSTSTGEDEGVGDDGLVRWKHFVWKVRCSAARHCVLAALKLG